MDDWEDENITPLQKEQPKNKWDDEDVDDDDVKESWEDDDEPAPAPVVKPPPEAASKKPAAKTIEKKGKTAEESGGSLLTVDYEIEDNSPLFRSTDKATKVKDFRLVLLPVCIRLSPRSLLKSVILYPRSLLTSLQRLVEEADYKSTTDLFKKSGDEKTLDNFIPKSDSDFLEYAELISHKLRPYEKSFHYINLLKDVIRLSMTSLKAADAKEVASSVTALANEKLKAEKDTSKKKTAVKKKQLHVEKAVDDMIVNSFDDIDEYDFM
ncbi:Eukaryotic translation initiation factor 3 subunit J, partial [Cucurbita argyrosperma subsp. sororia]